MARLAFCGRLFLVIGLLAFTPRLAEHIRQAAATADHHERLYYPSGTFLREASLGFHAPAADYVWLQATQYYGGYRRGEHDLRYFTELVGAVTTLDPGFTEAYRFASLVLSMDHADADGAIAMLRRGILANPDDWQLHFDVGFIHYVFRRDFVAASLWFEAAASLPGASDFCRRFAAFARRRGGDMEGSLILWENLRRTTESADMRQLAEEMIAKCQTSLAGQPLPGQVGPPSPQSAEESP
jgi:hypothetical protein